MHTRRVATFAVAPAVCVLTACLDRVTSLTTASITLDDPMEWRSCQDSGCFVAGTGVNEGPDCALEVTGWLFFKMANGTGVPDKQGRLLTYHWAAVDPVARLQPGESFAWVTSQRVPLDVKDVTVAFVSMPANAVVEDCSE